MALAALAVVSCGPKSDIPGFTKTESGLHYKFEVKNDKEQKVEKGDLIIGEILVRFNNDTLFANIGNPDRLGVVSDCLFDGDYNEGLTMMHKGEKAIFAVDADKFAKYAKGMPPTYKEGNGDKFYYEVKIVDIVTAEELRVEEEAFRSNMEEAQSKEPEIIANYIKENNITATPRENGLYVIVTKKGNGAKVAPGKSVAINYTGRLLDGTMFDTSREQDAREGNIYKAKRQYQPLSYIVGQQPLIPGWEEGVMGQPEGTRLTLIMPSNLAYGERGAGSNIPPFSPLTFDIEIVSVK